MLLMPNQTPSKGLFVLWTLRPAFMAACLLAYQKLGPFEHG